MRLNAHASRHHTAHPDIGQGAVILPAPRAAARVTSCLKACLLLSLCWAVAARADIAESEVMVVYNAASSEAIDLLATYRAAHPGIPDGNIVALDNDALLTPDVTYDAFISDIRDPIRAAFDPDGINGPSPQDVISIVLLRPFPHRIRDIDDGDAGDAPGTAGSEFEAGNYTAASVDSELVLLWQDLTAGETGGSMDSHADNIIDNPFHQLLQPIGFFSRAAITAQKIFNNREDLAWEAGGAGITRLTPGDLYLVCRIDGDTLADAQGMIERAQHIGVDMAGATIILDEYDVTVADDLDNQPLLPAPQRFLAGNDYEEAAFILSGTGWNVLYDDTFDFLLGTEVADPIIAYASYGENHKLQNAGENPPGHFISGYNFARGAMYNTAESYNARALNGLTTMFGQSQVTEFIAAGGTFAIGQVWEPFAFSLPDNEFFFTRMLINRDTFAESAYASLPGLSWQQVVLGDPLARVACATDTHCDDGNDCTTDTCDVELGCVNTPIEDCVAGGACCVDDPAGAYCAQVDDEAACLSLAFVCDVGSNETPDCGGPCGTTCFGDANGDGVVSVSDRGFISANINQTDPVLLCQYDMDGNGVISVQDRGFVSANIGLCTNLPDYQNGSGMNHGAAEGRFTTATYLGDGSSCEQAGCE